MNKLQQFLITVRGTPLYEHLHMADIQFRLCRRKARVFSLKLTCLVRTPVHTENGHFAVTGLTHLCY